MKLPILTIKCDAFSVAVCCQLLMSFIDIVVDDDEQDEYGMEFDCISEFYESVIKAANSDEQKDLQDKIQANKLMKEMKKILNKKG